MKTGVSLLFFVLWEVVQVSTTIEVTGHRVHEGYSMNDSWFYKVNFNIFPDEIFDYLNYLVVEPPPFNFLEMLSSGLCAEDDNDTSEGKKCDLVFYDEWQSSSDANETLPLFDSTEGIDLSMLRPYSPVSVLESQHECIVQVKRPRSKGRCTPRRIIHPIASPPSSKRQGRRHLAAPVSNTESHQGEILPNVAMTKRLMKKNLTPHSHNQTMAEPFMEHVESRRCTHCQVTETPQWREGPLGPKTLCNACGVRYRSGRLFPEYRPAASPTFIPSVHSNSHRKVLEMRKKANWLAPLAA